MNLNKDRISKIVIVGGGPAGSSLAIRLAKANFEVVLIERDKFPRQKLCGEFISPECLEHFRDLGVLDEMFAAQGNLISQTIFYEPNGKSVAVPSNWFRGDFQSALSLSRAEMDFRLLQKAKAAGAEVLEESNVYGLLNDDDRVFGVKIRKSTGESIDIRADLVVDASGRAAVLAKIAQRQNPGHGLRSVFGKPRTRYVGFKAHFKNAEFSRRVCEIYFFRGGYGGLSFIENGLANHCFLVKADLVKEFDGNADEIVRNVVFTNKRAATTLKNAEPVQDWLAVSFDEFGKKELSPARGLIAIGDASAFIDPFTGSGMLMALEGSGVLAKILREDQCLSNDLVKTYRLLHKQKFQKRLRICSLMRRAAFTPSAAKYVINALVLSKSLQKVLARATRTARSDLQN